MGGGCSGRGHVRGKWAVGAVGGGVRVAKTGMGCGIGFAMGWSYDFPAAIVWVAVICVGERTGRGLRRISDGRIF